MSTPSGMAPGAYPVTLTATGDPYERRTVYTLTVRPPGRPALLRDAVFYVGTNNQLALWSRPAGGSWRHETLTGVPAAPGASPAVVTNGADGQWVYYTNTNQQLSTWWTGPGIPWRNETLTGVPIAPGASPAAVTASPGGLWVYYANTANQIAGWWVPDGGAWQNALLAAG